MCATEPEILYPHYFQNLTPTSPTMQFHKLRRKLVTGCSCLVILGKWGRVSNRKKTRKTQNKGHITYIWEFVFILRDGRRRCHTSTQEVNLSECDRLARREPNTGGEKESRGGGRSVSSGPAVTSDAHVSPSPPRQGTWQRSLTLRLSGQSFTDGRATPPPPLEKRQREDIEK